MRNFHRGAVSGGPLIALIALTILGLGGFLIYQLLQNNQRIASLLVLPPRIQQPENRWIGEAWADSLIYRLQHAGTLRVTARESAWALTDQKDPREAAIDAGTIGVLSGEIVQDSAGYQLKVTLLDARDSKVRFTKTFAGKPTPEAALAEWLRQQPDFAIFLAKEIRADFDAESEKRIRQYLSLQPLAWKEFELSQSTAFAEAIGKVESALVEDLNFAPAYIALANRQLDLGESLPDGLGDITAAANMVQRAIEVNPDFGPAWATKGRVEALSYQLDRAKASFEKAILLAPGNPNGHQWFGTYYHVPKGDPKRAIGALKRALDLNPLSVSALAAAAVPFIRTQQYPQARTFLERAMKLDGSHPLANRLTALLPAWEALFPPPDPYVTLAKRDKPQLTKDQARQLIADRLEKAKSGPRITALEFASMLAALGQTEDAIFALEQGFERHDGTVIWMESDGGMVELRKSPSYLPVRARLLGPSKP